MERADSKKPRTAKKKEAPIEERFHGVAASWLKMSSGFEVFSRLVGTFTATEGGVLARFNSCWHLQLRT